MQAYRYIPTTLSPAANDTATNTVNTKHENQQRTLTGLLCSDSTPGVRTQVELNGSILVDVDNSIFATLNGFLPLALVFDTGNDIVINSVNDTGGAITNAQVTLQFSTNP